MSSHHSTKSKHALGCLVSCSRVYPSSPETNTRRLVETLRPFPGQQHLDVAGGTGDVAFRVLRAIRQVRRGSCIHTTSSRPIRVAVLTVDAVCSVIEEGTTACLPVELISSSSPNFGNETPHSLNTIEQRLQPDRRSMKHPNDMPPIPLTSNPGRAGGPISGEPASRPAGQPTSSATRPSSAWSGIYMRH